MEENQVIDNSVDNSTISDTSEQEKMLSQSQVNKIVQHEKAKAAQAAKREIEDKYQKDLMELQKRQSERNEDVSREVDVNAIYQQIQERFNQEIQQRQLKDEMEKVANSYLSKMAAGKDAYEDFEEITKDFDPTAFPQLTYLVSGIENAADIIYELSLNPLKLAGLDRIAEKNPRQAQAELLKLSQSISENKKVKAYENSNSVSEPLDRLKSSRISGSNDKMSIRDLRDQPWLRG